MSLIASERAVGYALQKPRMTAEEYLAWDAGQTEKTEFIAGEVFAMAGAGERHVIAVGNLFVALRQHLRGSPCRPLANDMKLRVDAADSFFYPDLMIVCGSAPGDSEHVKTDAVLVAEVLSPSTGAFDRGDKFAAYRQLPSLREYLLVDVDRLRCDLFRKGADGLWVLHPSEAGQAVHLASVDLTVPPEAMWADLEPAAGTAAPTATLASAPATDAQ